MKIIAKSKKLRAGESLKLKAKSIKTFVFHLLTFSLLLSAFTFYLSPIVEASFLDIGMGPRAIGMGNAFTGVANDGYACYYNPAGLAQIKSHEMNFSYASLYPGLDYLNDIGDGFFSYVCPLNISIGTMGISWSNRRASDRYFENSYTISYARLLSEISEKLLVGLNIKVLQLNYSRSTWGQDSNGNWIETLIDPVFDNGTSATGVSFDIGALFYLNDELSLGFIIKDLNQPDIKIKDSNPIPLTAKLGVGYYISEGMTVLSDFAYSDNDFRFNGGIEWWIKEYPVAIRGGFGVGSRNYLNLAMGASYIFSGKNLPEIQLDYAFLYPFSGLEKTMGSHRFGLNVRFK